MEFFMRFCKNKSDKKTAFFAGAAIGLIIFQRIYGFGCVNATNDAFLINGYLEKDIAQHYAGWMLFRNSDWTFPLGVGKNIAYPYGTAVSYTDSIPIFAVFFKIFRNILPQTFQYFGLFVMLCFMLQGGFGALLGNLFTKDLISAGLVGAIFTLSPVMIERAFRHCALTAHFLILAALYFYFENKSKEGAKAYIPFMVINALAIGIHPYFLPFTFGIMFAFCIERVFGKDKKSVLFLLASIALTLFMGYVLGAFYVKGNMSAIGYGTYNANLNSFLNPQSRGFENWSKYIGLRPLYIEWQIEGFNYLGLGVLLFAPLSALCVLWKYKKDTINSVLRFAKENFGLIFSAAALFVFAVGDNVSFGGLKLFSIPWPSKLTNGLFGIFRANGRFLWIVDYLIVLFIVFALLTFAKYYVQSGTLLLALLLCVQIYDMGDVLNTKSEYFKNGNDIIGSQTVKPLLKNPVWHEMADKCDCLYMVREENLNCGIDAASIFGKAGKAVNTRFEARVNTEKHSQAINAVLQSVTDGALNAADVLMTDNITPEMAGGIIKGGLSLYKRDDSYIVCRDIFTADEIIIFTQYGGFEICDPYDFL